MSSLLKVVLLACLAAATDACAVMFWSSALQPSTGRSVATHVFHLLPSLQVQSIVGTLLEALPTPSYSVQEAVSDCLAPLMSGLAADKTYVQTLAKRLLDATLAGPDYPHRYTLRLDQHHRCTLTALSKIVGVILCLDWNDLGFASYAAASCPAA